MVITIMQNEYPIVIKNCAINRFSGLCSHGSLRSSAVIMTFSPTIKAPPTSTELSEAKRNILKVNSFPFRMINMIVLPITIKSRIHAGICQNNLLMLFCLLVIGWVRVESLIENTDNYSLKRKYLLRKCCELRVTSFPATCISQPETILFRDRFHDFPQLSIIHFFSPIG